MGPKNAPGTTYLSGIVAAHRALAENDERDLDPLVAEALEMPATRAFAGNLSAPADGASVVIAEIKRRSPSRGDLAPDLEPGALAASYAQGGAGCISVLTDERFFGGSPSDLRKARDGCALPVLRKDFTVCEADVLDARLMGADAVLLIVAALTEDELVALMRLASRVSLDALVEVHDEAELELALASGASLIGVNGRDLRSFEVDMGLAARLAGRIPDSVIAVAESGIKSSEDVARVADAGYQGVLVGETLVTSKDPVAAVRSLTGHLVAPRRPTRAMAGG
jgi:indole-3-glycerol phosphate synthase